VFSASIWLKAGSVLISLFSPQSHGENFGPAKTRGEGFAMQLAFLCVSVVKN
jgi:hypothetical protein